MDGIHIQTATNMSGLYNSGSFPIYIGGNDEEFQGSINNVRIYNRALSSNEVTALYTLESTPTRQDLTNGLVAYYPFHGDFNDHSGNGNNATNHGAIIDFNGVVFNGTNSYISYH